MKDQFYMENHEYFLLRKRKKSGRVWLKKMKQTATACFCIKSLIIVGIKGL